MYKFWEVKATLPPLENINLNQLPDLLNLAT